MGVRIWAVLLGPAVGLCLFVTGCAKPRAQTAPPPPEPLPLHDLVTGATCGTPTEPAESGIIRPKPTYTPEPDYTDAARKAKVSGTVYMMIDVGSDGLVKNVCLARSFRKDLDAQSMKMVRIWKFEPARKDGVPITYTMPIEIGFHLY